MVEDGARLSVQRRRGRAEEEAKAGGGGGLTAFLLGCTSGELKGAGSVEEDELDPTPLAAAASADVRTRKAA